MAIRANVSFSQKHGQPDFGSVGAGCSLEFELDTTLLEKDSTALREQFDLAYLTCRQAVQQQLTAFQPSQRQPAPAKGKQGNNHASPSRPSTQSQQRELWAICHRSGLNLAAVCRDEFDVPDADCLAIAQASVLIDKLKSTAAVAGGGQ